MTFDTTKIQYRDVPIKNVRDIVLYNGQHIQRTEYSIPIRYDNINFEIELNEVKLIEILFSTQKISFELDRDKLNFWVGLEELVFNNICEKYKVWFPLKNFSITKLVDRFRSIFDKGISSKQMTLHASPDIIFYDEYGFELTPDIIITKLRKEKLLSVNCTCKIERVQFYNKEIRWIILVEKCFLLKDKQIVDKILDNENGYPEYYTNIR